MEPSARNDCCPRRDLLRPPAIRGRYSSCSYHRDVRDHEPDWTVLLLGGASGVGKSMLSHRLGRRLGVNLTEIDDFQIVLETATAPEQLPLVHFWRTNFDEYMSWTNGVSSTTCGCAARCSNRRCEP